MSRRRPIRFLPPDTLAGKPLPLNLGASRICQHLRGLSCCFTSAAANTWRCRRAAAKCVERARRLELLQRAESEFDPVPFDAEAARIFGRVTAAIIAAGRKPRGRAVDLMIAATAIAEGLPLYTTNPADFTGLDALIRIILVTWPPVPPRTASSLTQPPV